MSFQRLLLRRELAFAGVSDLGAQDQCQYALRGQFKSSRLDCFQEKLFGVLAKGFFSLSVSMICDEVAVP
jgi:hypothetical protein